MGHQLTISDLKIVQNPKVMVDGYVEDNKPQPRLNTIGRS